MPVLAKEVLVKVTTGIGTRCRFCDTFLDGSRERFEDSCEHLMKEHGLKCLHVGQETDRDDEGKPWHNTVAVFGK